MPVVTFYTYGKEQVGNTVSAIAFSTYLGITKNQKTLLVSTSFNDTTIQRSFWPPESKNKKINIPKSGLSQSGIEELDRIVRSNRMAPNVITNYTKVVLRERLEILDSLHDGVEQYTKIQDSFERIITTAGKYYDMVIVDADKKLSNQNKLNILKVSDVVFAMAPQKKLEIAELKKVIDSGKIFDPKKTLITLGRYDKNIKYNTKNISRSILKQRNIINAIPYSSLIYEGVQDGTIIENMWRLNNINYTDENYVLIDELKRLDESIATLRLMRG